jgi:DNA (cytosine-5)-methyltransferase 1
MDVPARDMIPVVDIFAGPGGLGEGFSSLVSSGEKPVFRVNLSIEKDAVAHSTLVLRSFYRQFRRHEVPDAYYLYLQRKIDRDELFRRYPDQAKLAQREAWRAELGRTSHKKVKSKIRKARSPGGAWVLIGGPPCQAYSLVGRSRMKRLKGKLFEQDRRHNLYRQYLRILVDHAPPIFIMENVKGILSSRFGDQPIFDRIISDLRDPAAAISKYAKEHKLVHRHAYRLFSLSEGTEVNDGSGYGKLVIRAEDYGVPQARHRVIILGVRSDLPVASVPKLISRKQVPLADVLSDLPAIRSGVTSTRRENGVADTSEAWAAHVRSIARQPWIKDGVDARVVARVRAAARTIDPPAMGRGERYLVATSKPAHESDWYHDPRLGGICNHDARAHMPSDLHRYFYAACYGDALGLSPQLKDFPQHLRPKHKNLDDALDGEMFSDRFRVQLWTRPSSTVTAHISKDGHYFIHPDPAQCRSLTVREAARLQTFPDNYYFEGSRTLQYHQVGNAVPPLLASQVAKVVYEVLKSAKLV